MLALTEADEKFVSPSPHSPSHRSHAFCSCKACGEFQTWQEDQTVVNLRYAIKLRRRTVQPNREEYLCVRRLSEEVRSTKWEGFQSNLEGNADPARAWNLIQSALGSPHSTAICDPLTHNGRSLKLGETTILPVKKAVKPPGFIYSCLSASHFMLSGQWREWYTAAYNTWVRQGLALQASVGYVSCNQILRITQTISDGFQTATPQGSLTALLDFQLVAFSKSIPIPFTRRLRACG